LRVDIGARSDPGRVRENNEDSYRVVPALDLFLLSDGVGGEACGEVASATAVEAVATHCLEAEDNPSTQFFGEPRRDLSEKTNRLASAVHLANQRIRECARSNPKQSGMGATILGARLDGQRLSLVHVGDSRAYLLRSGVLEQLTADHSVVAELGRRGIIPRGEGSAAGMQSALMRAVGVEEEVEVDADEHILLDGDVLLLCSDGLTRMVSDAEIAGALISNDDAQAAADHLVALANESGGQDNVTVIVLRVEPDAGGLFGRLRRWAGRSSEATSPAGGHRSAKTRP
jgi:serine/threonine protein phosphatase PrpC